MRVVAHLSDLHFGRIDPAALEPLRRRVIELTPDLVVISGDLTQRARAQQFREARAFLDSLPGPQIVVPGNHDVPLYNVLARFLRPLARLPPRDRPPTSSRATSTTRSRCSASIPRARSCSRAGA